MCAPFNAHTAKAPASRRIQTRRSGVHGRGVFALQDIAEGEVLVEYTGEVISWQEAQDRHPHDPSQPNHTFYFHVDEDRVIDAKLRRQLGALDQPQLRPQLLCRRAGRPHFHHRAAQYQGGRRAELRLRPDHRRALHPKLKAEYPCWCGAATCRGTLLAPKRGWRRPCPTCLRQSPARPKPRHQKPARPLPRRAARHDRPHPLACRGRLGGRGPAAAGLHGRGAAQHRLHQHRADAPRPRRPDRAHAAGGRAANRRARPPGPRVAKRCGGFADAVAGPALAPRTGRACRWPWA
jgi:hypothetical protein